MLGRGGVWRVEAIALPLLILVAVALGLAPVPASGAQHFRSLLEALGIDVPARPLVAPPLALSDLSGTSVRLVDQRGRPVMLYFWTTY